MHSKVIPDEEFVAAWQSMTPQEVADKFGVAKKHVHYQAWELRKAGVPLRRWIRRSPDVSRLTELARSLEETNGTASHRRD